MRDVAAGQTLAGIPDIGLLLVATRDNRPVYVRDVAKVVIGPSPQEHRVWMETPAKGGLGPRAGGQRRLCQARRRQCRGGGRATAGAPAERRGPAGSGRRQGDGDARLRRDRQRQGERAAVPSRPRHRVDRGAHRLCHRLARGAGDVGRHPDHHPAHAVRRESDGLHHQPRQPVRAHLLHRHPGRRRHRGDREHRPALGDEGRPLAPARRRSKRWPRSAIRRWSPR